jgi:hypothetical protein
MRNAKINKLILQFSTRKITDDVQKEIIHFLFNMGEI